MGCENQHHQYLSGLLSEDACRRYEATIKEQIAAFPGLRAILQLVKHTYGREFAMFVDAQIASSNAHIHGSMRGKWRALVAACTSASTDSYSDADSQRQESEWPGR